MKNLMLTMMAFFLACCFVFLLFIATNQQALAKVHETISSFSVGESSAEAKDKVEQKDKNSIKAAIKEDKYEAPYNGTNHEPIAKLTTHDLNMKDTGQANLPQFSKALAKAQRLVNKDNHASNQYNDYGIDSTCQGVYYYIFTFENKEKPNTFYRVTVNEENQTSIFDKSYVANDEQPSQHERISPQESEVIAQKHAVDELGKSVVLKKVKESKDGMFYSFQDYKTQRDYKVVVSKSGDVIQQPSLN
ncbi:hypothetical protein [Staphylococcus edaphicus]|uniref:Lipoprotein n=1 Tax=Staphylococcus edaphicus TaxID=1955013 RepID=A0A2C6WHX6_9STAP|nr:hypothetical protein [Staphylococcus edaphicus]PHK50398.1 hypothetical protein BTJ66_02820 [Staphylococcus edaphicus]UQW81083.1 hypothetical protein MNY58_10935 [Staphylococcus edaphicus]